MQKLNRQLLVLPGKLLEIRSPQLILDPPDFPLQFGDPLVVVRQLQPEHDAGVSRVKRPHGSVPEVVPYSPQRPRADTGQLHLALGQIVENAVGRAVQERKTRQVGQLVPVQVIFKVPQLQTVGVERLPPVGADPLGALQPAEASVQIRQMLEVRPIRRAVQELHDLRVADRLPRKEFRTLFFAAEVADHMPESSLIEFLADIVDGGVAERDDADGHVLNRDNVGDQVQDGLGLPGTRRPLDDRNRTGQGFLHCRALTEIAAERINGLNILGPHLDRRAAQETIEYALGVNESEFFVSGLQALPLSFRSFVPIPVDLISRCRWCN